MKEYLKIGDVSKIKGISVKALRYYDELGILPPIYVDKKTQYRYYSPDQLVIVDLIQVCLDLDIPLKKFKEYLSEDGSVDIGSLLEDGKRMVAEKEQKLKSSIEFLDVVSKHIDWAERVKNSVGEFVEQIPERYLLMADWNGDVTNYSDISEKYSKLYKQCKQLMVPETFNQGVIYFKEGDTITSKVYVEIPWFVEQVENLKVVEEGEFVCRVIPNTKLPEVLQEGVVHHFIVKELFELKLAQDVSLLEVQSPKE